MIEEIKSAIKEIEVLSKTKKIKVISHNDTDGITSAAIFSKAMKRWGKNFSLEIVKSLEKEVIEKLPESHVLIILDLGSGSLPLLSEKNTEIFILDHHEIPSDQEIPKNVRMINPWLTKDENISAAAICYLFAKTLSEQNKDLAPLAIIGMVGDMMDRHPGKHYEAILRDAEVIRRTGLLLYPATRPLDKTLEFSSGMYIPGVTGSFKGSLDLLREARIEKINNRYKTLAELTEEEMSNLITAVMLRKKGSGPSGEIVGNIFMTKFFNKLEDAREMSALINACSRNGEKEVALKFCLGNKEARNQAEKVYAKYKQNIAAALKYVEETEKITGNSYTIINAQDKIKDTIIGTIASIMSFSPLYQEGTIIVAMAYDKDKIKVSARIAGRKGRNVREILKKATIQLSEEVGGHPNAAGCLIPREKELQFITELRNILDVEVVKMQ